MVDRDDALSISRQCALLGISRSSVMAEAYDHLALVSYDLCCSSFVGPCTDLRVPLRVKTSEYCVSFNLEVDVRAYAVVPLRRQYGSASDCPSSFLSEQVAEDLRQVWAHVKPQCSCLRWQQKFLGFMLRRLRRCRLHSRTRSATRRPVSIRGDWRRS